MKCIKKLVMEAYSKIDKEKNLYQLGNQHGLLNVMLSSNSFGPIKQNLVPLNTVNLSNKFGIREMSRMCSVATGQGYIKCGCKGACDKKCKCKQSQQVCNS